jgi:thiamine biosynthesis lipoprotein
MLSQTEAASLRIFKQQCKLMGNQFELSAVTDDEGLANTYIQAGIDEIKRIERLLTTYRDDSETNRVNSQAGITPVEVSRETFELVERAQRISAVTQGAFDLSYGSVDKKLWNFDTNANTLPDKKTALKMVRLINYKNIVLNKERCTVF